MRKLTHYELTVLIKNEINLMAINSNSQIDIKYIYNRCKDIFEYVDEIKQLAKDKGDDVA